jgi:DNA polymerase-3 subunit gamma/tau
MMSSSAFNALLKTLEEPPTYVIFILATTEQHKLPTTIVSRCQRFDFRRISTPNIISRLTHISRAEGIDLTEDGARVIARIARGGMRDAISLLELAAGARKTVTAELVFDTVGSGNRDGAYRLIRAILDRDFAAVYSTVAEVVEKSGDISVFWQEIIDSYRDIMVVKNTEKAKDYLDLTDSEYKSLSALAADFTPQRLAYHTSILEGAMADMQRAFNSKRSIAEIALTRMCDARTAVTPEALALRIDELERELSLVKLGAVAPAPPAADAIKVLPTTKEDAPTPPARREEPAAVSRSAEQVNRPTAYAKWGGVVERIGELKRALSVQFKNSTAHVLPDGSYLIRMNAFFAKMLASSDQDLSILRGIIAEREGCAASEIRLVIEPLDSTRHGDLADEIANKIDN